MLLDTDKNRFALRAYRPISPEGLVHGYRKGTHGRYKNAGTHVEYIREVSKYINELQTDGYYHAAR